MILKSIAVAMLSCLTWSVYPAKAAAQQAQGGVPSPSGPTMEQTVSFINDSFEKAGDISIPGQYQSLFIHPPKLKLDDRCSLILSSSMRITSTESVLNKGDISTKVLLHLDRSDPLSVSVSPASSAENGKGFTVLLAKASVEQLPLEPTSTVVTSAMPDTYNLDGLVRSVDGGELTIISDKGVLTSIKFDSNVKVVYPSHKTESGDWIATATTVSDIAPGDNVGVLRQSSPGFKKKDPPQTSQQIVLQKAVHGVQPAALGYFVDEDLANRVAKAYIHALVLCHKDEKSSLF